MHINGSRITNNINTLPAMSLFEISYQSQITISNTDIENNDLLESHKFMLTCFNSSSGFYNSTYRNNNISSHIVTTENSSITFTNIIFMNNRLKGTKSFPQSGLLLANNSFVAIRYCQFISTNQTVGIYNHHILNFFYSRVKLEKSAFVNNFALDTSLLKAYTCGIKVLDCTFKNNSVLRTFVITESSNENNFLLVNNSFFKSDYTWTSIYTERLTYILIFNSYFYHIFTLYDLPGLQINTAKSVRMKNSIIDGEIGSIYQLAIDRGINLFTLNSTFRQGNTTLVSNEPNFINKAEKEKCITNGVGGIVQEEIGYASSKYR